MRMRKMRRLFALPLTLLLTALLFPAVRLSAAALRRGDVTGDGKVTAEDARLCLRCAVGLEKYDVGSDRFKACDFNGDGKVTAADARLILRAAVGLSTEEETPRPQKFTVPMTVYESKRGTITLTGYQTRYDEDYGGPVQVCTFSIKNLSSDFFYYRAESVTVNGLQMPDPEDFGNGISPMSAKSLQVVIPPDYFDISQAGSAIIDEILMRVVFETPNGNLYYAAIAMYPTNKAPGDDGLRAGADRVEYKTSEENAGFLFGFQGAQYGFRTEDGVKKVDYADARFYFKNKSGRDVYVDLYGITLNGSVSCDGTFRVFVFAGTAATPEIYLDPNFFAGKSLDKLRTLQYTIAVTDAQTGGVTYSESYTVSWN